MYKHRAIQLRLTVWLISKGVKNGKITLTKTICTGNYKKQESWNNMK